MEPLYRVGTEDESVSFPVSTKAGPNNDPKRSDHKQGSK